MELNTQFTSHPEMLKKALTERDGEYCVSNSEGTIIYMMSGEQLIGITAPAGKNFLNMTDTEVNDHIVRVLSKK